MHEPLTPAEWTVMSALWEYSPASMSEVIRTIGERANWKYNTYSSYLQILMRKGFVGAEKRGRDKYYYPLLDKAECVRLESTSVMNKVHPDAKKQLVVSMIEQSGFSQDDHAELIALLNELMAQQGEGQ